MLAHETMYHAVRRNPLDSVTHRIYSDALEDEGLSAIASQHRKFADMLELPVNEFLPHLICKAVEKANARMRMRILSVADVESAVYRAYTRFLKACFVHGGSVGNSYGYRAYTALVLIVIRADGRICVDGGQANATSVTPVNIWKELKQWREDSSLLASRLQMWAQSR